MGHYRNVAICCGEKVFDELKKVLKVLCPDILPDKVLSSQNGKFLIFWEWINWDGDFPEIKEIYSVLGKFADSDKEDEGFFLLCVGETVGDMFTMSNDGADLEIFPKWGIDLDFAANWKKCSLEDAEEKKPEDFFSAVKEDGKDIDVSKLGNCPRGSKSLACCATSCINYFNCRIVSFGNDVLRAYARNGKEN